MGSTSEIREAESATAASMKASSVEEDVFKLKLELVMERT
jgi:hypothetical protein